MDIFHSGKRKGAAAGAITLVCCLLMVIVPDIALSSARKGISLWLSDVLPALLPFFVCANFLQNTGAVRLLHPGVFPFAMSVISGYPMGAKIVGDLKRQEKISLKEAKRLMSFCSTSGPAFMAGAVGAGMLGSEILGCIITVSHYVGALMNGFLYTMILGKEESSRRIRSIQRDNDMQGAFTEAILMSFRSLGIVLAYIVLFMFVTDLMQIWGILSSIDSEAVRAMIKGFLEMTVGCEAVAECTSISDGTRAVLCAFIMSWGGLSVMGQTVSMLSGAGIPVYYLMISKLTHGLFSASAAFVIAAFVV